MPNWCDNRLAITGERHEVDAFITMLRIENDDFYCVKECLGGWAAEMEYTGTFHRCASKKVIYRFRSRWTPPLSWLKKTACDHPTLVFRLKYHEPMGCFRGIITAQGNTITHEHYSTKDEECEWRTIPESA